MRIAQKTSGNLKLQPFWAVVFTMFTFVFLVSPTKAQQIRIGNGAHFVNGTNVSVKGDGIVNNGTINNKANGVIKLSGNWQNDGACSSETGSVVTLDGSSVQVIGGSNPTTFGTLSLNNSAGFSIALNTTVNGTLDFQNGIITTGSNILTIGSSGTITGASSAAYVNGKLARSICNSGSDVAFPIGKGGNYRPLSIIFSSLTGPSTVLAEQIESLMPGSVPDNVTVFPDRYWVISQTGGSNMAFSLTLTGTGFTPSTVKKMIKGDGSVNTDYDVTFSTPNYTNSTPFSSFSIFGLGEYCVPQIVTFQAPGIKTYGDPQFAVSAIGGDSGNPVIFSSSDLSVANCSGTNGTTITIIKAGTCTITAIQAGNTNYCQGQTDRVLTINPKPITVTADASQTKVYGSVDPTSFTFTLSPSLVGTDAITGLMGRNPGEHAGNYAFTLGTLDAGSNYTLSVGLAPVFTITPKPLMPVITAAGKCYDRNVTATLTSQTLTGVIAPDVVTLSVTSAEFDNATAGTGKTVTAGGLSLGGAGASNYTLAVLTATTTADIYSAGQVNQPSDQVVCNSASASVVIFATTNTGGTTTYEWTNDNTNTGLGAQGTGNVPAFTATNTGTSPVVSTIVVTPTFNNGQADCSGPTKSFTISVNPTGQVNQPSSQFVCHNANTSVVTFATLNTGGTTTYAWTNNNTGIGLGAQGTGDIAAFIATNPGTEPVVATIVVTPTFSNGGVNCSGPSKSFTITVNPTGQVNQPASQLLCNGSTTNAITFSTVCTGGTTSYSWTNDNTGTGLRAQGTGDIGAFIVTNPGTSPVVATIVVTPTFTNDGLSCAGPTRSFTITVNPSLPVGVSIEASANNRCAGSVIGYTATPVNAGINPLYQWKVNGNNVGSNNPLYVYIPLDGDVITCVLTVVNPEACFVGGTAISNSIEMTVYPHLEVGVSTASSANPVCTGTPVTVTATPVNGGSSPTYQWMVNNINAGTNNPEFTFVPANGDQVICVLTSSEQCTIGNPATSNTVTIAVNPLLPVSISIAASANPVCTGTPVNFTATAVNGGSNPLYQWKVNAINVGANNPVYEYVPSNGDVITCVLTACESCISGNPATSNAISLTVNPLPIPVLTGPITAVSGATGVVYTTQSGQLNYTWNVSPGGTITAGGTPADPTATVTWNTAGAQWISVNYSNPQTGCSGAAATRLDVTVTQASFISITSPNGGESWSLGSVHNITWNDNITGDVTIELFKDGEFYQTITAATPSTGTYEWTIDRNQEPGADYHVKIYSTANPALYTINASGFRIINDIPIDLEVRDIVIADGVNICFDALQTIFVAGGGHTFVVQPGGSATLIAGQNILYLPGTTVQPGGYMHGYITQTDEYCWSVSPSFVSTSVSAVSDTSPASRVTRHDSPVPRPVSRVPIPDSAWFRVYPNPTDGKFMVEYVGKDQPGTITVEVFGMKGERILTKEMTNVRKQEFSLEGRANGIYLVRIVAEEATETVRVLKR